MSQMETLAQNNSEGFAESCLLTASAVQQPNLKERSIWQVYKHSRARMCLSFFDKVFEGLQCLLRTREGVGIGMSNSYGVMG